MIIGAVLKWCVDFIFEPLSYVCTMSRQEGIFPEEHKLSNAIILLVLMG